MISQASKIGRFPTSIQYLESYPGSLQNPAIQPPTVSSLSTKQLKKSRLNSCYFLFQSRIRVPTVARGGASEAIRKIEEIEDRSKTLKNWLAFCIKEIFIHNPLKLIFRSQKNFACKGKKNCLQEEEKGTQGKPKPVSVTKFIGNGSPNLVWRSMQIN